VAVALAGRRIADDQHHRNAIVHGAVDARRHRIGVAEEDHDAGGSAGHQLVQLLGLRGHIEVNRACEGGLDAEQGARIGQRLLVIDPERNLRDDGQVDILLVLLPARGVGEGG